MQSNLPGLMTEGTLMIKSRMKKNYSKAALSEKVLRKIWDNEEDEIWKTYL